jgi:hypothetical protein
VRLRFFGMTAKANVNPKIEIKVKGDGQSLP